MRAKKSLGQHFLRDTEVLQRIADAARLSPADTVLEVGPGDGALTALLLERAGTVVAVEKDARLMPLLREKFAREIASQKLILAEQDILAFSPSAYNLTPSAYKIVANLPYYITGQFLRKFLQSKAQPNMMVLLLQKEVARRIVGGPASPKLRRASKESILSMSVRCYGTPRYLGTVGASSFSPPPKVDSAILAIEHISKEFFSGLSEEKFFSILKRGFAHPRKLLASNLGIQKEALVRCGIAANARAENVTLEQWKCIACAL